MARAVTIAVVGALLAFRITLGVDMTDESYYASFLDGWIKTDIQQGTSLGLHQTAALLVYPFALLYVKLLGSVDGLMLFLRALYLATTACVAFVFYRFAARLGTPMVATFAALWVASFIPFSLPAPSYNTIGMLGMVSALAAATVHFLDLQAGQAGRSRTWVACSAISWTIAVVAYPTLVAVQVLFVAGLRATLCRDERPTIIPYVVCCGLAHAVGASVVVAVFGPSKLLAMLDFSNASLQVSSGFVVRVLHLWRPLGVAPAFDVMGLCMIALGAFAHRAARWPAKALVGVGVVGVLFACQSIPPVLYAKTHDLVLLAALLGAGIAWGGSGHSSPTDRILRLILAVGLLGGLITALTATNGLVNFAVGGFFAAAMAMTLVLRADSRLCATLHLSVLGIGSGLLLWNAFSFVYGEPRNPLLNRPTRVAEGVFENLLTSAEQAQAISTTTRILATQPPAASIVVFGRLPGIYLLTTAAPLTLSTWDFGQHTAPLPKMEQIRGAFFGDPRRRAVLGVTVSDPWTKPPSAVELAALSHYQACQAHALGLYTLTTYTLMGSMQDRNCRAALTQREGTD